jgi:hypothetical protein
MKTIKDLYKRRGARSTGNLRSMSFRAELAELRALVAARRKRERNSAATATARDRRPKQVEQLLLN